MALSSGFSTTFIVVLPMADYKLKVSLGLLVALDGSLICIAQLTQIEPHSVLFVAQRTQQKFYWYCFSTLM
jgi:hypothetical protein